MNIHDIREGIKSRAAKLGLGKSLGNSEVISYSEDGNVVRRSPLDHVFLALVVILVATLSFGLGRLSVAGREGVSIENDPSLASAITPIRELASSTSAVQGDSLDKEAQNGPVYASSKGTKYYYPSCHSTISEKNKVTFATKALAEAAGYSLAANCSPK